MPRRILTNDPFDFSLDRKNQEILIKILPNEPRSWATAAAAAKEQYELSQQAY